MINLINMDNLQINLELMFHVNPETFSQNLDMTLNKYWVQLH